jgi:hypothetical protein
LFLLIRKRVIAFFSTENYGTGNARVTKFAMRSFAAGHYLKPGPLKISNQLANFARHNLAGILANHAAIGNSIAALALFILIVE